MALTQDDLKRAVAQAAIAYVPNDCIVGVGTGSTANFFIDELARIKGRIRGAVASSEASTKRLQGHGIEVLSLNEAGDLPVYVDGADEITRHMHMLKGGGGALTREKIVAAASKKFICVCDASKLVDVLGKFPLPVEVISFARTVVEKKIVALGGAPKLRTKSDGSFFVTDNGNQILDCSFGKIVDPARLARALSDLPGVVEHGLFIGLASLAIVGRGDSAEEFRGKRVQRKRPRRKPQQPKRRARKGMRP